MQVLEYKIGSTQEFQEFFEKLLADEVTFEQLALQHYRVKSELALLQKTVGDELDRAGRIIAGVGRDVRDWPGEKIRWVDESLCWRCHHCYAPDGSLSTGNIVCGGDTGISRPYSRVSVPLSGTCGWFEDKKDG